MAVLLQSILSGVLIGGVYALIGIGLTLIFGVMRVINFAQGELVMVGMYVTFFLFRGFGVDPFASVLLTMPALFILGAILQSTLINRVLGRVIEDESCSDGRHDVVADFVAATRRPGLTTAGRIPKPCLNSP